MIIKYNGEGSRLKKNYLKEYEINYRNEVPFIPDPKPDPSLCVHNRSQLPIRYQYLYLKNGVKRLSTEANEKLHDKKVNKMDEID